MGHYTPQMHLRRFEIEGKPDFVCMYDRESRQFKALPCKMVAQEKYYYPPDIEEYLNILIEVPGNRCVRKLMNREPLNDEERFDLACYMMTMSTRGPRMRKQVFQMMDKLFSDKTKKLRDEIIELKDGAAADRVEKLCKDLDAIEQKWKESLPAELRRQIQKPHFSARTVGAIQAMSWEICPAPEGHFFLTSDTPVHFFESLGVGKAESEFTFSLSKDYALIGHHYGKPGNLRFLERCGPFLAKEINRRIISTTERFIFSHRKADWIDVLAQKPSLRLNLIRWDR